MQYNSCLLLLLCVTPILAYKEITGLLERTNDLTREEINALRPLFEQLQQLYDHIASQVPQQALEDNNETRAESASLYAVTQQEFGLYFAEMLPLKVKERTSVSNQTGIYDTKLPSVAELMGELPADSNLSAEALAERADIESILQDALDEAQTELDKLVLRALSMETQFIKINKPKLVETVFKALSVLFSIATRVSRAAYCTYSHIPQLNETLHHIYNGVDCYTYTTGLVLRIQHETVQTVSTIKKNVYSLAGIYKKIAAKHSLLGKLSSLLLNVLKIQRNIKEAVTTALQSLSHLENDLPVAAKEVVSCGLSFVDGMPEMIETVTNVTTCILYVEDTTTVYDFMKPESQRVFNTIYDDNDDFGEINAM